jgi:hypothetical protein
VCPEVTPGTETAARFVGQLKLRAMNGTKATFCRKFVAQGSCSKAPVPVVMVLQTINRIFIKFVLRGIYLKDIDLQYLTFPNFCFS